MKKKRKIIVIPILLITLIFFSFNMRERNTLLLNSGNVSTCNNNLGEEELILTETSMENVSYMEVHFIDVGQGDATLIKADNHYMLIDAGDNTKGSAIWSYLYKQGVSKLDYLILTHTDADHIGGADVIISKLDIETVFLGDFKKNNNTYQDLMAALEYKRLTYSTPDVGSEYRLGNAIFTIIAPNTSYDDPNNSSIALILKNGNNTFFFSGDCEEEAEKDILTNGIDIDCDVYKVGHHGSKTASSMELLEDMTPTYAVVSCAEDNAYGHPHAEVLNKLRSINVKLFRTDEQGSIIAYSDGKNITWNCAPTDSWKAGEITEISFNSEPGIESIDYIYTEKSVSNYPIVGNMKSRVFHSINCKYLPQENNRVYYGSREDAIAAGCDDPCNYCTP